MRYFLSISIALLIIFIAISTFLVAVIPDFEFTYRKTVLVSPSNSSKLYIKSKNWGITDDKQLSVISLDDDEEFQGDSTKEFVYKGLEPFLFKVDSNTLFIYTKHKTQAPTHFDSNWIIKQIEVDNPEMIRLRANPTFARF